MSDQYLLRYNQKIQGKSRALPTNYETSSLRKVSECKMAFLLHRKFCLSVRVNKKVEVWKTKQVFGYTLLSKNM